MLPNALNPNPAAPAATPVAPATPVVQPNSQTGEPAAPATQPLSIRDQIRADLFPTTPEGQPSVPANPSPGAPVAPVAPNPAAPANPVVPPVTGTPDEQLRANLQQQDYDRRVAEIAAQQAQLAADQAETQRLLGLLRAPTPGAPNPAAPVVPPNPQTPPLPDLPFDLSRLNPDDFETDTEVALAQALQSVHLMQQHTAAQLLALQGQLAPTQQMVQQITQQQQEAVRVQAERSVTAGASAVTTKYGVALTPEQGASLLMKWGSSLEHEFAELTPDVVVRAWELENMQTLLAARAPAPAGPASPPSPPELSPPGARPLPTDPSRLSVRELIKRDLAGQTA